MICMPLPEAPAVRVPDHIDRVRMAADYTREEWFALCQDQRFLDALFLSIPEAQVIAAEILTARRGQTVGVR